MPTVETSIEVDAPPGRVFDLSQDYGLRLAWDPFVRAIRSHNISGGPVVGGRVWVKARNGLEMTVEYVTVDRPHRLAVRMVSRSGLFARFAGSWAFEGRAPGWTHVVFRYGFETRWRWLRPLLDRAIVRIFGRDLRVRVAALKRAAEDPSLIAGPLDRARAQSSA